MSDFSRTLDHIIFLFKSHQWYPLILGKPESFEHWPLPDSVTLLLTALPSCTACGILVPRPPAVGVLSPNRWTSREGRHSPFLHFTLQLRGGLALSPICLASLPLCVFHFLSLVWLLVLIRFWWNGLAILFLWSQLWNKKMSFFFFFYTTVVMFLMHMECFGGCMNSNELWIQLRVEDRQPNSDPS